MEILELVLTIILSVALLGAGIFLLINKGTFVVIGYRNLSNEDKAKVRSLINTRGSIILGIVAIATAVTLALTIVAMFIKIKWLLTTCFVLVAVMCVVLIIAVNVTKVFKFYRAEELLNDKK